MRFLSLFDPTMAKRPPCTRRNICSFLFFTLFLTDFVFAQVSQKDCEGGIAVDYSGLYSGVKNEPPDDRMKWCPWWPGAAVWLRL